MSAAISHPRVPAFRGSTTVPGSVSLKSWIAVLGSLLGGFMAVLDIQITNASLNDIVGSLGATLEEGAWISTAYLVAEIIVIPLSAWLATVFSTRRYMIWNASLFLVFSVLCAWSHNLQSMILFRALQGLTGGILIPMSFTIMLKMLPPAKQPVGFALFGITATFAPAIGPTIGGWLTDNYGWGSIFYLNLLPGALLVGAMWYGLEKEPMQLRLLRKGDWWGILTMAIGLGSFTIFAEEGNRKDWFGSMLMTRLAVLSAVTLTAFVWIELKVKRPFINLRLFARRNFGFASTVNLALGMGLYGSTYLLPLYLTQVQGYNALQIGYTIMWVGLPQLVIMPFVPILMKKVDPRFLVTTGVSLFAMSCFMNSFMTNLTAFDQLLWSQVIRALGQPLIIVPLLTLATGNLEKSEAGSASGLFNMLRNLGGSSGIALLGTLITRREHFHSVRIGESVTPFDPAVQARLDQLTQGFINHGADAVTAGQQALAALNNTVRREAFVMAYNDAFFFVGAVLLTCGLLIWFCRKVRIQGNAAAH